MEDLWLIYNDKHPSFNDVLEKDNSIHHKNLQALAMEMFRVHSKTSRDSRRRFSG